MSDELNVNSTDSNNGVQSYLNFGFIGYLVLIGSWILGVLYYWEHYGFFKSILAIGIFTIVYLICASICGAIGNALRLYTMPTAYFTDGTMRDGLKKRLFWTSIPQSIGIIIGLFLSLEVMGMVGFNLAKHPSETPATQQQTVINKTNIDKETGKVEQNTSAPNTTLDKQNVEDSEVVQQTDTSQTQHASLDAEREQLAEERRKIEAERQQLAMVKRPPQTTVKETARDGSFIAYDNGTVLDTRTNLMWAAKDNGSDINWANAKSYCENYRGGGYTDWRMPTQDELAGLYDKAKTYKSDCGYDVHLTELFHLTCTWAWALKHAVPMLPTSISTMADGTGVPSLTTTTTSSGLSQCVLANRLFGHLVLPLLLIFFLPLSVYISSGNKQPLYLFSPYYN